MVFCLHVPEFFLCDSDPCQISPPFFHDTHHDLNDTIEAIAVKIVVECVSLFN